jgi:hypothetical protein
VQGPPALDPTPPPSYQTGNGQAPPQPAYATAAETRPVRRQPPPNQNGHARRKASDEPKPRGSWGGRILILLAILALLSVIGIAQFLVKGAINNDQSGNDGGDKSTPTTSGPPPVTNAKATIVAAKDFDPEPAGNGEEHPDEVKNTYDGKPSTTWTTQSYKNRPDLGGQKPGVGIWYDLGQATNVSQVTVTLVGDGTNIELMVPADPSAATAPATVKDWKSVAKVDEAGDSAVLKPATPSQTRFVLVWLTSLPKDGSAYRGEIAEVAVQK